MSENSSKMRTMHPHRLTWLPIEEKRKEGMGHWVSVSPLIRRAPACPHLPPSPATHSLHSCAVHAPYSQATQWAPDAGMCREEGGRPAIGEGKGWKERRRGQVGGKEGRLEEGKRGASCWREGEGRVDGQKEGKEEERQIGKGKMEEGDERLEKRA